MNFAQIKRKITAYLKQTNFNFQLDDIVNSAIKDIERLYNFSHMYKELKGGTISTGDTNIAVPPNLKMIYRLAIVQNEYEMVLKQAVNIRQIIENMVNNTSGLPFIYLFVDNEIKIAPKSDKDYTYNLYYFAYTEPLVNNTDSNIWTNDLWDILLYWVLYEAYLLLGNETNAGKYYQLAQLKLAEQYKIDAMNLFQKQVRAV